MFDEPEDKAVKRTATDRLDATTAAAQEIVDQETAKREAKTARLRTARLAQEDADER